MPVRIVTKICKQTKKRLNACVNFGSTSTAGRLGTNHPYKERCVMVFPSKNIDQYYEQMKKELEEAEKLASA